jgi:predicted MFS family arabinose efflux permease
MLPELASLAGLRLERMNAAFEGVTYMALLVGPAVAGVLVSQLGPANVLWLDAASFAFSAVAVRLAVPRLGGARTSGPGPSIVSQLTAGLRFLAADRLLLVLAVQLAISNFFSGPFFAVALPVYARDVYGSATQLGLLLAAIGLGSIAGTVVYGLIGHRLSRRLLWLAGYFALPLQPAALVLGLPLGAVITIFVLVGLVSGPVNPLLVTVRHERIPPAMRGRVFSTFSALAQVAQPLGIATGGAAIEVAGIGPALTGLTMLLALMGLSLLALPVLREMDKPAAERSST